MQLRSIGFLRACLEHSGKPVVASGQDFMRFPATDAENASTEAGGDQDAQGETINRHAHFLDSSKERLSKPAAQQASPSQKSPLGQHLQSWLEVATSEALNPSKNQREKSDKTSKQSSQVSWTQNPQGSARTPPGSGLASPSGSTRASRRPNPERHPPRYRRRDVFALRLPIRCRRASESDVQNQDRRDEEST